MVIHLQELEKHLVFKLPVINIGTRQHGRLRAKNVIDVDHDTSKIIKAIDYCLNNNDFKKSLTDLKNPYGDGTAAKKIVDILENIKINKNLIQKKSVMKYNFKKVLVTGGAGCIGIPLSKELCDRGIEVVLFDLYEQIITAESFIDPRVIKAGGSILDSSSIREAMIGCDAVIHLAAHLGVRRTEVNKLRCLEINIDGTKKVLEACIANGNIKKFIFASSSEVYGEPLKNPISESDITQGKTLYGVSKISGEELVKAYNYEFPELEFSILRYFNTYGPYQISQFVISKFISRVLDNKSPIIYGDGLQIRSYNFSEDTARGTADALLLNQPIVKL